jgi:hypothetical protein
MFASSFWPKEVPTIIMNVIVKKNFIIILFIF